MAMDVAALGPEVSVSEPSDGYVGTLGVRPLHAPVGATVNVTGDGFAPGSDVQLVWRTVKGSWKTDDGDYNGRDYSLAAYEIARIKTDDAGRFSHHFAVPEDFGFAHDVVVQQGNRLLTQSAFNVDMTVKLSPTRGPVGTPITVEVQGIGWRQMQNSWMLLYDNKYTGWVSAVTTRGSARFTIPAAGRRGRHVVEMLHGDFTFPYRNMQQSPEPDRPRFVKYFEVTRGAPVLPIPPQQQSQDKVRRLPAAGTLSVTPKFAPVGTPVSVLGARFAPGQELELKWGTVTGNRVGTNAGWEETWRVIATARADSAGRAEFHFKVPDDLGGAHTLLVEDRAAKQQGSFWTVPSALPLDASRGPAGTQFNLHLKGVGWTETANIYTVVYDNNYIGYACGFNSQGDVQIAMQATGEPGWHFIDLYPAIYKGRESRPLNFRVPQLTYEADHPAEDLPRFRFAFLVTGVARPLR